MELSDNERKNRIVKIIKDALKLEIGCQQLRTYLLEIGALVEEIFNRKTK